MFPLIELRGPRFLRSSTTFNTPGAPPTTHVSVMPTKPVGSLRDGVDTQEGPGCLRSNITALDARCEGRRIIKHTSPCF